jgi:NDP-sugar pyrophosphorylase family protein
VSFSAILLSGRRPAVAVSDYSLRAHPNNSRRNDDGPSTGAVPAVDWSALRPTNVSLPTPLSCVELFGQSVLERTVARFKQAGLRHTFVIAGPNGFSFYETKDARTTIPKASEDRCTTLRRLLLRDLQCGIDTVLIAELGAYVEIDLRAALQFHRAIAQPITPIRDARGSLAYWIVDAARVLAGPDFSFPFEDDRVVNPPVPYQVDCYVNRLASPRDFRNLVIDSFFGRCSIKPSGREVKPGVWVESGARIHKTARLVAPCYVGSNARIKAGTVITRCSNLERNCEVGEGSLVFDASLFPHTMVGRGLDISTAVVDRVDFVDLTRNVMLHIQDPNLISDVPPQKQHIPAYLPEYEDAGPQNLNLEPDSSQYARAKGRFLEVFKGEV